MGKKKKKKGGGGDKKKKTSLLVGEGGRESEVKLVERNSEYQ